MPAEKFLIPDNLRAFLVTALPPSEQIKIELFDNPSYSPQPGRTPSMPISQKRWASVFQCAPKPNYEAVMALEQNPHAAISYFQDRRVKYAA